MAARGPVRVGHAPAVPHNQLEHPGVVLFVRDAVAAEVVGHKVAIEVNGFGPLGPLQVLHRHNAVPCIEDPVAAVLNQHETRQNCLARRVQRKKVRSGIKIRSPQGHRDALEEKRVVLIDADVVGPDQVKAQNRERARHHRRAALIRVSERVVALLEESGRAVILIPVGDVRIAPRRQRVPGDHPRACSHGLAAPQHQPARRVAEDLVTSAQRVEQPVTGVAVIRPRRPRDLESVQVVRGITRVAGRVQIHAAPEIRVGIGQERPRQPIEL